MYHFGAKSTAQLITLRPELQAVCRRVIQVYDFSILEGHRTPAKQNEYYNTFKNGQRLTEIDGINQLGKHNVYPSDAMDLMPWPDALHGVSIWDDRPRWCYFAGLVVMAGVELGVPLRWGGDWDGDGSVRNHKFLDFPHFEFIDD